MTTIFHTYPWRCRTAANKEAGSKKPKDPGKKSIAEPWLDEMRAEFWSVLVDALPDVSNCDVE